MTTRVADTTRVPDYYRMFDLRKGESLATIQERLADEQRRLVESGTGSFDDRDKMRDLERAQAAFASDAERRAYDTRLAEQDITPEQRDNEELKKQIQHVTELYGSDVKQAAYELEHRVEPEVERLGHDRMDLDVLAGLAQLYILNAERYDEAEQVIRHMIMRDERYPRSYFLMGLLIVHKHGDLNEAKRQYRHGIDLEAGHPTKWSGLCHLGIVNLLMGNYRTQRDSIPHLEELARIGRLGEEAAHANQAAHDKGPFAGVWDTQPKVVGTIKGARERATEILSHLEAANAFAPLQNVRQRELQEIRRDVPKLEAAERGMGRLNGERKRYNAAQREEDRKRAEEDRKRAEKARREREREAEAEWREYERKAEAERRERERKAEAEREAARQEEELKRYAIGIAALGFVIIFIVVPFIRNNWDAIVRVAVIAAVIVLAARLFAKHTNGK